MSQQDQLNFAVIVVLQISNGQPRKKAIMASLLASPAVNQIVARLNKSEAEEQVRKRSIALEQAPAVKH